MSPFTLSYFQTGPLFQNDRRRRTAGQRVRLVAQGTWVPHSAVWDEPGQRVS